MSINHWTVESDNVTRAVVAFVFLPDSPDQARFLNEEEMTIAKARGVRQVGHVDKRVGGVSLKDIGAALLDPNAGLQRYVQYCDLSFCPCKKHLCRGKQNS